MMSDTRGAALPGSVHEISCCEVIGNPASNAADRGGRRL
jgi:hypothetical protein